ncbi:MAG: flagellar biosynthesis anti-sigma factor FlgM [Candidatus Helarchaeota archaeon]|nr:flagellar biosynthesis anti-sigma factor FlgM [Candidatus Helarchaeota archaeon]
MRISSIVSIFKAQIFQRKQVKASKENVLDVKDTVVISKKGKALQKDKVEFLVAKKALSEIPDVRQEKIQSALSKIETNFYNNPGVKEDLSKMLLASVLFNTEILGNRIASKYKTELKRTPNIREEKVNKIGEKIKNSFYNSKKAISELSEKILRDLGI